MRLFPSDLDAFAWHWVAQYENRPRLPAEAAFDDLIDACAARAGPTEIEILGSADRRGWHSEPATFSADPESEYFGELQGLALRWRRRRRPRAVRGMLQEGDVDLADFDAALDTAAERVSSS